jgi:hypothetical protein
MYARQLSLLADGQTKHWHPRLEQDDGRHTDETKFPLISWPSDHCKDQGRTGHHGKAEAPNMYRQSQPVCASETRAPGPQRTAGRRRSRGASGRLLAYACGLAQGWHKHTRLPTTRWGDGSDGCRSLHTFSLNFSSVVSCLSRPQRGRRGSEPVTATAGCLISTGSAVVGWWLF